MALVIEIPNNREGYVDVVQAVLTEGKLVNSRVSMTLEIFGATIVLADPANALPVGIGRGVNTALAAVEAASLVGGVVKSDLLTVVAPNFTQFMDNGEFHGAYGPRTRDQYPHLERRLRETPDTRQAVASIWVPERDQPVDGLHDYPCTLSHAFYIREGKLQLHTTMRSNDVWWGWAYDCFMFTQLQLTMANILGIEPGPYFHHAVSLHLYERDFETATKLVEPGHDAVAVPHTSVRPNGFYGNTWKDAAQNARDILDGGPALDPSESWYATQIERKLASLNAG